MKERLKMIVALLKDDRKNQTTLFSFKSFVLYIFKYIPITESVYIFVFCFCSSRSGEVKT